MDKKEEKVTPDMIKPMPERRIDFGKFAPAASKTIQDVVVNYNLLRKIVIDMHEELEALKLVVNEMKGAKHEG